LGQIKDL